MKVLLITVRSDFGGGPRHVDQLVSKLPNDIELYLANPEGEPYGTRWRSNGRIRGFLTIPYRTFSLATLFAIRKFVVNNDIHIIHSHGNGAGLYSRLLKLLCKDIKVIHTFHGITDNYTSKLKAIANLIVGEGLRSLTDDFILVSNGELQLGERLGFVNKGRSHVIYNGIEDAGEKQNVNNGIVNIVTLSRFDYQKNMDMAFSIASSFKEDKRVSFTWVGDGDDFMRLKELAKNEDVNIKFVGFSTEPMKYLKQADVYLSTSRFEGLPYALVEAASVGLPIVATNVRGNKECVKEGKTGFLFNTVEEGVGFIKRLLDENLRNEMGHNARLFYLQNFTINQMMSKIVDIYKQYS